MSRKFLTITTTIFSIVTLITGFIFIKRYMLKYNSEGNYFDPHTATVYQQQALVVYGLLTVLFLIASILSYYFRKRASKPNKNNNKIIS